MSIKKWVSENEEILVLQGTKLEDKTKTPVVMITTDDKRSGNAQKYDKNNGRGNKGNNNRRQNEWNSWQQGRNQGQNNDQSILLCGFCNLIKENEVSQEYVNRDFKVIHWNVTDECIWSNQCLPWLMLSMEVIPFTRPTIGDRWLQSQIGWNIPDNLCVFSDCFLHKVSRLSVAYKFSKINKYFSNFDWFVFQKYWYWVWPYNVMLVIL